MRIAITGASGHYGRIVVEALIAAGRAADLILISRDPAKLADYAAQGCTVRQGNYDQPETMAPAMAGADRMLLISGTRVGARVVQHQAAVNGAVAAGVRHVIYTSFIGIDDPANPAEVRHDHIETERLIKASGLQWTMLRDAHYADAMIVMAGPGVMAAREWISNAGNGVEAMVWREDCALCAAAVLTGNGHEGKTYDITGPDMQSFADVTAIMAEVTGVPLTYRAIDDAAQYAMFDAMGIPRRPVDDHEVGGIPWNSDDMVTFGQAIREGFLAVISSDVQHLLGRPARSVRAMIEAHSQMLRAAASG